MWNKDKIITPFWNKLEQKLPTEKGLYICIGCNEKKTTYYNCDRYFDGIKFHRGDVFMWSHNYFTSLEKMIKDDNDNLIFAGDILRSNYGYDVIVQKDGSEYYGLLICEKDHPCKNMKYDINNGKGHVKNENH